MDTYFLISIHPNSWKYLRIAILDHVYQFTAFTFGHVIASRIFSEVMREMVIILRKVKLNTYAPSKLENQGWQTRCSYDPVCEHPITMQLTGTGNPTQVLKYTDILFDLALVRVYYPQKMIRKIQNIVSDTGLETISKINVIVSSRNDKLNSRSSSIKVPLRRLHYRPFQYLLRSKMYNGSRH